MDVRARSLVRSTDRFKRRRLMRFEIKNVNEFLRLSFLVSSLDIKTPAIHSRAAQLQMTRLLPRAILFFPSSSFHLRLPSVCFSPSRSFFRIRLYARTRKITRPARRPVEIGPYSRFHLALHLAPNAVPLFRDSEFYQSDTTIALNIRAAREENRSTRHI